jgi:hypothetical protein
MTFGVGTGRGIKEGVGAGILSTVIGINVALDSGA